jgi:all-trans-retinol 13,14-reductase
MPEYDVIVAGGGISGLMSALTLSKHGKRVLVLGKDRT